MVRPEPGRLPPTFTDLGATALEEIARKEQASSVFLVADAATALYSASRTPHVWNATVGVGDNPRPAVVSNKLFGANTQLTPVLWVSASPDAEHWISRLKSARFNVTLRAAATVPEALDWLAAQQRDAAPYFVDCETGNPKFARCFWLEATGFDPKRRNDVLNSTRVPPGSGAYLGLGGFGYQTSAPGPGVLVEWLPPDYSGPLKLGDRMVSVAGRQIRDGADYVRFMDEQVDGRAAAVMIQRGKERVRLETRIVLPEREELITVRMQGSYAPEQRELMVITRGISALRIQVPPEWSGAAGSWNGEELGKLEAGCWDVGEGGARRCQ